MVIVYREENFCTNVETKVECLKLLAVGVVENYKSIWAFTSLSVTGLLGKVTSLLLLLL